MSKSDSVEAGLNKAGIASANRHLFLCMGPDCCPSADAEILWDYIKKRVRDTGIPAMRTKAQCFRICAGGPWLVVYPDGTWYGQMNPEKFERVLNDHLIHGNPVSEWITITNVLNSPPESHPPS